MLDQIKKYFIFFAIFVFTILFFSSSKSSVLANNNDSIIHIFSSKYCPHCREAEKFLEELK